MYDPAMIYLDYNASTPVDPAVREAMWPYLERYYGNPSSGHALGRYERAAIDRAREQVAGLIGADPSEIVFTSGGTEASNHAVKGVAFALRERGRHIIVSKIEHPATINPCRFLERQGYEISYVNVDRTGMIDPQAVIDEIRPDTILISIMHANNEVGTIEPIAEISAIAREAGVWMHTDAAQSCGKIPVRVDELGVDFLSIAGHKLYAPQGIGALYIREGIEIEPLHHGAGHERGRRSGTEPVAGIVGLGAAAAAANPGVEGPRLRALRDRLYEELVDSFGDDAVLLGHETERLPNTLAVGFRGRFGTDVLAACPDICASTGAACHSGTRERSAVLAAMDVPEEVAFGLVRFSVGRFTTEQEIDQAVASLSVVARGR